MAAGREIWNPGVIGAAQLLVEFWDGSESVGVAAEAHGR